MKFFTPILLFLSFAFANPISEPSDLAAIANDGPAAVAAEGALERRATCTVTGSGGLNGVGTCAATSSCLFVSVPNFCPGGSNNQCCRVIRCSGPYSAWTCRNTYKGCGSGFSFKPGYCPGNSGIQCCAP